MALFTDSISQILTMQNLQRVGSKLKPQQVAQIVRQGSVDSVDFSAEAKKLFSIFESDTFFDTAFGVPSDLTDAQQKELQGLQDRLQLLTPGAGTSDLNRVYDYFTDYAKRVADETATGQRSQLEDALNAYVISHAVTNLFGSGEGGTGGDLFTKLGEGNFATLFASGLSSEEQQQLGKLSLQLNRLFFTGTSDTFSPLLEQFNRLYGLKEPDEAEILQATSLFERRNGLLADLLRD